MIKENTKITILLENNYSYILLITYVFWTKIGRNKFFFL